MPQRAPRARRRPRAWRGRRRAGVAARVAAAAALLACLLAPASAQSLPGPPDPAAATAAAPVAAPVAASAPAGARRPKIGVVLSGGGARGLTHIGVLKVLDELRIPVDYISATSMGAIVGGMYASGMPPRRMEEIVTTVDWTTLFSDSPPRRELEFRDKERETRYPLPLEIGFRDGRIRGFQGALSGGNLELFLHSLTAMADGVRDFDQLPIPYRAVSTDMVSGQPYVFSEGPLYEAMRASMSIPGVFAPAEIRGRILGDGGLVDNLPVDVVRRMGAEVVIAVNIGTPLSTREQLSSIVGLTTQMINILTEQNVRAQLASLRASDVLISPDLGQLTAIDFNQGPEFIARGEAAARQMLPLLAPLALPEPAYAAHVAARPPLAAPRSTVVDFVRVEGPQYANPKVLEARLAVPLGQPLDATALEEGIGRLLGSGEYERIDYRVVDEDARQGVVVEAREKAMGPNYLRFGVFYLTDFQGESSFALLMGHRRVWVDSLGAEWRNEIAVGRIARAATEFYQPFDVDRIAFASAYASTQTAPRYVFSDAQRVAEYSILANQVGVDFGIPFRNAGELRIGPQYTFWRGSPIIASPGYQSVRETDAGVRLLARWDNTDNAFFPQRGLRASVDAFYGRRKQEVNTLATDTTRNLARIEGYALAGIPLTPDDFFNVAARGGGFSRDDPSLVNPFLLGGLFNLSGLRDGQLSGTYVGFARAVYYHRLARWPLIGGSVYAGASLEAGNAWIQRDSVSAGDLVKAGSVFLAADTFLGPVYFAYGRATGGQSSFYLLLGRPP